VPISSIRVFSQQVLLDVLIAATSSSTTLWTNGALQTVTGLTHGLKLNSQGQVVGSAVPWVLFPSSNTTTPNTVGIVWSASKGTQNLNSLIGTASSKIKVTVAKFINDAGQIAAEGQVNGENHMLLLTPKP
jgi:hypothetical protein